MLIACLLASTVLLSSFLHGVQPSPACPADSVLQHLISSGASQAQFTRPVTSISWSRGVTVSTLDSESSDRSSNPRGTSCPPRLLSFPTACFFFSCPARCYLLLLLPFCRLGAISMLIACLLASTVLLSSFLHGVQPSPACPADSCCHLISSGAPRLNSRIRSLPSAWSRASTVALWTLNPAIAVQIRAVTSCAPRLLSFPTACFFAAQCPARC